MSLVDKSTPKDLKTLLKRLGELEEKIVRLEAQNTLLKAELARKDKIIAALQQRLFGSSSEPSGAR
jgi:predicted RNase H-like nuclease (RuvC/YqgF family)